MATNGACDVATTPRSIARPVAAVHRLRARDRPGAVRHGRATYARYVADGCVVRPIHVPCGTIYNAIHAGTDAFASLVVVLQLFPVVIGVFVGAPLLSREFESGTFRFTWTQGVGRTRFVITTLIFLAGLTMAAACILGLLLGWYAHPFEVIGAESQWQSGLFNATGFTLAAWTLFALVLGTFLGALIKRTVTATVATAVSVGGLVVASFIVLVHRLLAVAPLTTSGSPFGVGLGVLNTGAVTGEGPSGSWLVRAWVTGPGGRVLSTAVANNLYFRLGSTKRVGSFDPTRWLSLHHAAYWVSYQPASRFWIFQGVEGGVLVGLAVLLAFGTIWLVHRS